ncbi:M48 family metalloprotease [Streptomyces sp. NBC_00620]|uniref:M48 family metalloprotease n=1 Tax=Streptomyces sp. NBC_00620 TaxID=2903666 RepID=UPI00225730F0|nr:M48 family metalloprotease [Streptomyces sp. NBC_00620]MCX4972149.1 M48 family metalloprotease [Streptomyces sp. NBC_00620]
MSQASDPQQPEETPPPGQSKPPTDDLDYRHRTGRLHLSAHQRGIDATAFGQLVLRLPSTLMSLLVLLLMSGGLDAWLGVPFWIPPLIWLASGALVFHRPTEDFLARHLLRLQRPLPEEYARLAPVWREVTARAGIDSRAYELWIEDSEDLNAYAAAGHIVGVTRFALEHLPSSQLAAILAHELGHHTGGHVWTSLLGEWYALPGRLAWRVIRYLVALALDQASRYSWLVTTLLIFGIGLLTITTIQKLYGLPLILLATPYLIAAVGRRAELRADQHAAVLGFARELAVLLEAMHQAERETRHAAKAAAGHDHPDLGFLARLLSTHPDYPTRLHRLRPYL